MEGKRFLERLLVHHHHVLAYHPKSRSKGPVDEALYFIDVAARRGLLQPNFLQVINLEFQEKLVLDSLLAERVFCEEGLALLAVLQVGLETLHLVLSCLVELLLFGFYLLRISGQNVERLVIGLLVDDFQVLGVGCQLQVPLELSEPLDVGIHRVVELDDLDLIL